MKKYFSLRSKRMSFLIDKKAFIIVTVLSFITIVVGIVSTAIGTKMIPPMDVLASLFGYGSEMNQLVVTEFRLPRILLAFLAGAALAMSGAILQGLVRNPLASPDIIGVTKGATFATVGFLSVFSDRANSLAVSIYWMPLASFFGAFVLGLLVYILAWKNGVTPFRLVLIGIGLHAAMQALTTMVILKGPIYLATQAHIWILGSVNGSNWSQVLTLLPWLVLFFVIILVHSRKIIIQELGDEIARGVGSLVQRDRIVLLLLSTALAGGAVAFAGGIGFVGLMAPHIARKLVGSAFGGLMPAAALIGGIIVMISDLIGRTCFTPLEVPAGVFTAVIGAPYFIYLLYRSRHS